MSQQTQQTQQYQQAGGSTNPSLPPGYNDPSMDPDSYPNQ